MLTEERYEKILEILDKKGVVTVKEITEKLNSSDATTRRDFNALDKMGRLKKVHGGATKIIDSRFVIEEEDINTKENINKEEKNAVGKMAASLIEENDFVYIDAGTSTGAMIKYIDAKNVTFVTNGLYHALDLSKRGYKVFILAGETREMTGSVVGSEAVKSIQKYNFTKGFFGTNGIDIKAGYTTYKENEGLIKEAAIKKCKDAYVLTDSSKFNKVAPITFSALDKASIITSNSVDDLFKEKTKILEAK